MDINLLKRLIKSLKQWTENGNCTLFFEKSADDIITRVDHAIDFYEEGRREKRRWLNLYQELIAEEKEINNRYIDLISKVKKLEETTEQVSLGLGQIKASLLSGDYNVNEIFKSFNLLHKVIDNLVLNKIAQIRNTYPGLISRGREGSMILSVKILETKCLSYIENYLPKKVEEIDNLNNLHHGIDYLQFAIELFKKESQEEIELVNSHCKDTTRDYKDVIDIVEQIEKSISSEA